MLDIEEKLKTDDYKNKLLESLHLETQRIKGTLDQGLAPNDYSNYSNYAIAIESSIGILEKYNTTKK